MVLQNADKKLTIGAGWALFLEINLPQMFVTAQSTKDALQMQTKWTKW